MNASLVNLGADQIFGALTNWIVESAVGVFDAALSSAIGTTTPNLGAQWFRDHYSSMLALAAVAVVPLLLACAISSIIRQDPARLVRAVFLQLPLAGLGTVLGVELTQRLVDLVDLLCTQVWPSPGSDLASLNQNLAGPKGVGAALVAGLLAIASLTLWLELALRQAAIYATTLLLPLFLAGLVWPATVRYAKRTAETLVALILSKLVIAAVLSLGLAAVGQASRTTLQPLMAGAALTLLASLAPWVLLRLVPVIETAAAAHLDGVSKRSIQSTTLTGFSHQAPHLITEALRNSGGPSPASAVKAAVAGAAVPSPAAHGPDLLDTSVRELLPRAEDPQGG